MIERIKNKLKELGENVQVGICKKGDTWDCLLIRRKKISKSGTSKMDHSFYLSVTIIKENEIPEGMADDVIAKMKEIGFKQAAEDIVYGYAIDSNEIVIENCEITFVKPRKG